MSKALQILEEKHAYHLNLVRINLANAEEHKLEASKYATAIQEHKEFLSHKAALEASSDLTRILKGDVS